jgi:predicted membrane metal-binding protein
LWPLFAAITTRPLAWLIRRERAPPAALDLGLPEAAFGDTALCLMGSGFDPPGELPMFDFQDLFQWDRFITPTIIKTFYWLIIGVIVLFGMAGILSALSAMAISPFYGFILLLSSIASVVVGVVFSRIAAEFILIVFRINEHLGAIRDQGGMR